MFKRLAVIAALLWCAPSFAQVTNPLTRAGIGGIPECKDPRVFCVGKQAGAEHSAICDMTPGSGGANSCGDPTDLCTASSALGALRAAEAADPNFCSPANPCFIEVGPGTYNECVHFDAVTDVTMRCDSPSTTRISPTVTAAATSVTNGTIRFGVTTTTRNSTARVGVFNCYWDNLASSAPEAAGQLGKDGGPGAGNPSSWTDIELAYNVFGGSHDGEQNFGSQDPNDRDLPRAYIHDNVIFSGADPVTKKGWSRVRYVKNLIIGDTNACEATDPNVLAAQTGTLQAGTLSAITGTMTLASNQIGADDEFRGRKIVLSDADGGGGGTCGATNRAQGQVWASDYVASTKVLTFDEAGGFGGGTDATGSAAGTLVTNGDTRPDGFWVNAYVRITEDGGTCEGQVRRVTADVNNVLTVDANWTACTPDATSSWDFRAIQEAPTSGCRYDIVCVTHNDGTCYRAGDTLDPQFCTNSTSFRKFKDFWKLDCLHFGTNNDSTPIPPGDYTEFSHNTCEVYLDDFSPSKQNVCPGVGQSMLSGVILYDSNHGGLRIANNTITLNINADLRDYPNCLTQIGCLGLVDGQYDQPIEFTGNTCTINNRGDPEAAVRGIIAASPLPSTVIASGNTIDINNTVAGYVGITETIYQAGATVLKVDRLTVPDDPITMTSDPNAAEVIWVGAPETIASYGDLWPQGTLASAAWAAGDIYCTKTHTDRGTGQLATAGFRVITGLAATTGNVCIYTESGARQLFKAEGIATTSTGGKSGALAASGTLPPGDYWGCVGSDATATMTIGGRSGAFSPPTSVAFKLTTGGATCPATINPAGGTQVTTAIPEWWLGP